MNKSFLHSVEWEALRRVVLDENRNECQMCKAAGAYGPGEVVHHVLTRKRRPDLALDKGNLMAICEQHHYKIHHTIEHKVKLNIERW